MALVFFQEYHPQPLFRWLLFGNLTAIEWRIVPDRAFPFSPAVLSVREHSTNQYSSEHSGRTRLQEIDSRNPYGLGLWSHMMSARSWLQGGDDVICMQVGLHKPHSVSIPMLLVGAAEEPRMKAGSQQQHHRWPKSVKLLETTTATSIQESF